MMDGLILDLYVSSAIGFDGNPGTGDLPLRSMGKAAQMVQPGATVHVAAGAYEGGFQTVVDGVTYVSDVKWGAKIVPGPGNNRHEAWDNRGANVIIDGFEIDGGAQQGGAPWLFGVYTAGSNSVVRNTKVHDIARGDTAMQKANTGVGGAGIMGDGWGGGVHIEVVGNEVYRIGPADNASGLVHGVYMATSGQVLNNVIGDIAGDGVTTWHDASNVKIVNNTVFQARGAGVMIGSGDHYKIKMPNDYSQVSNNILYDNTKGIEENGWVGIHNIYTNNLVHGNKTNFLLRNGKATGTVNADPKFIDYRRDGGGDYRLKPDSPAIDAGDATHAPAVDRAGVPRPQNKGIDIGAYEESSGVPMTVSR